ncbi:hypothetical protein TR75_08360 [Hydrogenibacillus schlegelii]|uniref:DUF554 domain-containing protein n=1 Tax=Hydrogenibacillus schlegelii TaxID=1484 RepID=UPI000799D086|nr:DUF554 domain-containing protein [Hydrogenibacillus schlegelii]KWX04286.1 hypothetical protein TR75_08360 [Hydrogenibacillus schlegelii]
MILAGTLVNGLAIVAGTLIGLAVGRAVAPLRDAIFQTLGLAVVVIGLKMALAGDDVLGMTASLAAGAAVGRWADLEGRLNRCSERLTARFGGGSRTAEGFLAATLLFGVGSMSILGALQSGLEHDHRLLYLKALLDGVTSVLFAGTFGAGVALSAAPIVLFQGSIALAAGGITALVPEASLTAAIDLIGATGGVLIAAIGLNMIGLGRFRVADLLPAVAFAALWAGSGIHLAL